MDIRHAKVSRLSSVAATEVEISCPWATLHQVFLATIARVVMSTAAPPEMWTRYVIFEPGRESRLIEILDWLDQSEPQLAMQSERPPLEAELFLALVGRSYLHNLSVV